MSNDITDNTFFEVQAEKFYQKKVEVARGVIELGQILIETKKGFKGAKGAWTNWLEDGRVNFTPQQARKYMRVYNELGQNETSGFVLNDLSLNKLYTLASAPEEIKEDVANSKDKEEAEKKIKEYEEQLKQEKLAKDILMKSKQQEIAHMQDEITNLKNDIGSLEKERINLNNQIKTAKESGRQEEIKRLQPKLDKANRDIEEKEELIKKLNKYNLTEKEIDTANIKFEQSSQSITLAVEVEYNVQKIISEISKLRISDLYNNSDEVVYRDSVLKIVYLAQNELNKIISELSPNEKVSTYNNQDIIEGVYYHE